MPYYVLENEPREIRAEELDPSLVTAAYLSLEELEENAGVLGFAPETVASCRVAAPLFRTAVEEHTDYTFTQIRIAAERDCDDDWIALYLRRNAFFVIDIRDNNGSTRAAFDDAIRRTSASKLCCEKVVSTFIDSLFSDGQSRVETLRNEISDMEETVLTGDADETFIGSILLLKKKLLKLSNFYAQILDLTDTLEENENDVIDEGNLLYIANLTRKVTRLREDIGALLSALDHLQDAYSSSLDMKLNRKMNILTVITTLFFPLTIIVGWYGMNFQYMPEFAWRFGYVYVIALSVLIVAGMTLIAKVKKWF